MRITFRQSTEVFTMQVGPVIYGLEPRQIEPTLEAAKTLLVALNVIPEDEVGSFLKFADATINIIKRMQKAITIEGERLTDPDTVVHLDLDPTTLMLTSTIESAPEVNLERKAKLDIAECISIYKDILKLLEREDEPKSNLNRV